MKIAEVDVVAELEKYSWERAKWTGEKLIANSPFRYERRPSFFVNLDKNSKYYGCWHDSGALDSEWQSGNFIKLLSFLRGESYEETKEYLKLAYGKSENLTFKTNLFLEKTKNRGLKEDIIKPFIGCHQYFYNRGISKPIQKYMKVGFKNGAVMIPWKLPCGSLGNVKYRSIFSKAFWYEGGGYPIKNFIYAINVLYEKKPDVAVITEGEIDALTLMTAGFPSVALGNSTVNKKRVEMLIKSPVKTFYICTDNDGQGQKIKEKLKSRLIPLKEVRDVIIPQKYKDINEAWCEGEDVANYVNVAKPFKYRFF